MPVPKTDRLAAVVSHVNEEAPANLRDLVHGPTASPAFVGGSIFFGWLEGA
jgi:hypothetical protein